MEDGFFNGAGLAKRDGTISTKQFKIIMLGDSGVGKTALIQRFIEDQFAGNTSPTLAWDFKVKAVSVDRPSSQRSDAIVEDKELVRMYVWDTAG